MEIRLNRDPETGLPHIDRHNVTEEEVRDVLRSPLEEIRGKKETIIATGQSREGRYLKVVYVPDRARRGWG